MLIRPSLRSSPGLPSRKPTTARVDGAAASLDALPAVVEAVGGRVSVPLDSGVRGCADVFKALALGARAVLIGRPYVYGLAIGVERVQQLRLALRGGRLGDDAAAEDETDPGHLAVGRVEQRLALDRLLDRAAEDLAAGDVRVAVVDLRASALERQPQVRAGSL